MEVGNCHIVGTWPMDPTSRSRSLAVGPNKTINRRSKGIDWIPVKTPPAPVCEGHQSCGFRTPFTFQQSPVMLSAFQCCSAVKRPQKNCGLPPPLPSSLEIHYNTKIHQFSSLFPGSQKTRKTALKDSKIN